MISLTVLYPNTAGTKFDMDYYVNTHTPLVRERLTPMGLTDVNIETGLAGGAPDTPPAFTLIARLSFDTIDDLQAGLAAHGPELIGDILNFTDTQPIMQVSQKS